MWLSNNWRDYELIDCSGGERLERWGEYIIVRPDPQVIWDTPRENYFWSHYNARYERSASGGGSWVKRDLPTSWTIKYGDLRFNVKPMNFKHTGLFPEQASNWDFIADQARRYDRQLQILNLFAYTGAATVAAAAAGCAVCHVDAAKGMVAWAKENAASCGLESSPIRWIVDDCLKFVERELRRGRRYDAIIMDPPSYGRGPSGEVWKLEDDLWAFVSLCTGLLSENPAFALINTYTSGLAPSALSYICDSLIVPRFDGVSESQELGLPVTESGLALPCGAACRWMATPSSGDMRYKS